MFLKTFLVDNVFHEGPYRPPFSMRVRTIIAKETFCHLLFSTKGSGLDPPIFAAMRFRIA